MDQLAVSTSGFTGFTKLLSCSSFRAITPRSGSGELT
jgi:hypothetical protein